MPERKTSGSVVFSTAARRFFLFCAVELFTCGEFYKGHFSVRSACGAENFTPFHASLRDQPITSSQCIFSSFRRYCFNSSGPQELEPTPLMP